MNLDLNEKYITDEKGKKKVVLDIKEFKKMVQVIEDLDDLRHIAKRRKEKKVSLEEFISDLKSAHLV